MPATEQAEELVSALESMLLVHPGPASIGALASALGVPGSHVLEGLQGLQASLQRGIRLQLYDGRAQLVTAPENWDVVRRFLGSSRAAPLSRAALEVVAIVAFRQPVTRAEIEAARGVNSDRPVMTLLARELIEEVGRRDVVGRPAEFCTTFGFLEYFGLTSLDELPPLDESQDGADVGRGFGLRTSDARTHKGAGRSAS